MKPTIPGRLHAQGLAPTRFETARDVVHHLCCVQSQMPDMSLWGVGRRTTGLTIGDVRDAFAQGEFIRTHVLRPTWHYVDPDDIHWLLALTAPRVAQLMASSNAGIALTPAHLDSGADVIVGALADGPLTRTQLAQRLADAGKPYAGQALAHVVMHAEINALIVNGPMTGKQHTYRLLAPRDVRATRDELLARAALRYGLGHGPFRDRDLAWWTSLTLTDARRAIRVAELDRIDVAGEAYWSPGPPIEADVPRAMLLPAFDEYVSYARDDSDYAGFIGTTQDLMRGTGLLMIDGTLAGTWTRALTTRTITIAVTSSARATRPVRRLIEREAAAFAQFVDRELDLTYR